MESKEFRRTACLGFLKFLGPDSKTASLKIWNKSVSEYIQETTHKIEGKLDDHADEDLPRAGIIAQLSVLAILVSKEFDAALEAIITGEWEIFDRLFEKDKNEYESGGGDWHDFRTEKIFLWCSLLIRWVEQAEERLNSPPVRELEYWEKRLWCEEVALSLPRTPNSSPLRRRYNEANRLHLSIDPFTPVEIIAKKVTEIVKRFQEEQAKESIDAWQNEIQQGVIAPEVVQKLAIEERANYDDTRTKKGKIHRTLKTRIRLFLQQLTIYYLLKGKRSHKKIAEITEVPTNWRIHLNENNTKPIRDEHNRQKEKAKMLIETVLRGESPLTVRGS